jgi:hypothetical protein|tara:strand:+ start:888 stop:1070 length:183 start_codon:yes stop_codon:yes gene_type:complete
MDDIDLANRLKKTIEERKQLIQETLMSGRLSDMEMYKSILGEINALTLIEQTISEYFKGS